jgi:hypothetical protein
MIWRKTSPLSEQLNEIAGIVRASAATLYAPTAPEPVV